MDIIYTNTDFEAMGVLNAESIDISIGGDADEFEIIQDVRNATLEKGALIYAADTEWGGIVRHCKTKPTNNSLRKVVFTGPTFSGMLAERIVVPPSGQTHYHLQGEANSAIGSLLSYLDLDDLFAASEEASGITLDVDMDRFCNAFEGLRKALATSNARICIYYDHTTHKVRVGAAAQKTSTLSSENSPVEIAIQTSVNHLVCAGTGELLERVVVHLYANSQGAISQKQTLFGLDRIDAFYENTNAELDELIESGTEKFEELIEDESSASISFNDALEDVYALDQVIVCYDSDLGLKATTSIAKKVFVFTSDSDETFRYESADAVRISGSNTGK